MIDFTLSKKQKDVQEGIRSLGKYVIRPMSLSMDRNKEVPEDFLRNFMRMAKSFQSEELVNPSEEGAAPRERDPNRPSEVNRTSAIAAEELAWADAAIPLSVPGPGLGGPPIRATGTPEQKERFFGIFKGMHKGPVP